MSKKVQGVYRKSRTKGLDKPDPKRRGAAAYELMKQIKSAREWAKWERKGLSDALEDTSSDRKRGIDPRWGSTKTKAGSLTKVNAHRQVQALKQAYENLPEAERVAGSKKMIRAVKKGNTPHSVERQNEVRRRLEKHMSYRKALMKAEESK